MPTGNATALPGLARLLPGRTGQHVLPKHETLQPAVTVRGRLLSPSGAGLRETRLQWTLPGWNNATGPWPFVAVTDDEGYFHLRGVPTTCVVQAGPDTPELPPRTRAR